MLWSEKQKRQGVKLIVNWWAARKCWRKYISGKTLYFQHPNSAEGYAKSAAEYYAYLASREPKKPHQEGYETGLAVLRRMLGWYDRFGTPDDEEELERQIGELTAVLENELASDEPRSLRLVLPDGTRKYHHPLVEELRGDVPNLTMGQIIAGEVDEGAFGPFGSKLWKPSPRWAERFRQVDATNADKHQPQTVSYQVQRFLQFKAVQVAAGERSPTTWRDLQERLGVFEEWIGPATKVSEINGTTVRDYYHHLLRQKAEKKIGGVRANNVQKALRQFVRWAWREDDVDLNTLPRNIDDPQMRFSTGEKDNQHNQLFTPDELHDMWDSLSEPYQLYVLLALNGGFTQVDIAFLRKDELRVPQGRIIRRRTKTKRQKNIPVVNYKLWQPTLELLKRQLAKCKHPELALTNSRGTPLIVNKIVEQGGEQRSVKYDTIGRNWGRMRKRKPNDIPDKPFKFWRKTGSTALKNSPKYRELDKLYLGHAHQTIADRHYNLMGDEPYQPLDDALEWLGIHFRVNDLPLTTPPQQRLNHDGDPPFSRWQPSFPGC